MSSAAPAVLKRRLRKDSSSPMKLDESGAALPSLLTAIRELEEKIQCQTEKLQSLFNSLSSKITEVEGALIKKIDTEVSALSSKVNDSAERIIALEDKHQRCEAEVEKLRLIVDKVEAQKIAPEVAADAVVFGLPYTDGENLKSAFNLLCLSIDFHSPQIRDIFRIKRTNNNSHSVVIIKFFTPIDRNRTLRAFSDYRRRTKSAVSLSAVGLEGNISIFESLVADTRKILQEAIRLRRAGKLVSVFTLRGAVYVRVNKGASATKIDKQNDLQKFC